MRKEFFGLPAYGMYRESWACVCREGTPDLKLRPSRLSDDCEGTILGNFK